MDQKIIIKVLLFTLAFSVSVSCSYGQSLDQDTLTIEGSIVEQKIEKLAEQTDAELDYSEIADQLEFLTEHRLNLNNGELEQLVAASLLSDLQVSNLNEHIRKNGKLISLLELQSVEGFDIERIRRILPFVCLGDNSGYPALSLNNLLKEGKNSLLLRLQQVPERQQGFDPVSDTSETENQNARYLGNRAKILFKYRYTYYNRLSIGITGEKDAGEEFFKGTQKNGFDFYSAHLIVRNLGLLKTAAIGDYSVQFGQGLVCWTGLSYGGSADGTGVKRVGQGLKPYTSAMENGFMRGAGITMGKRNIELTVFGSSKRVDANLSENDTTQTLVYSSLQETGLHTTPAELNGKHAIRELAAGSHIAYIKDNFNIGATVFGLNYNGTPVKTSSPYNQFQFNGSSLTNSGIDYSLIIRNLNFFGEVAYSSNSSFSLISGVIIVPDSKVTISLAYRNYGIRYQSVYAGAFGMNSLPANEKGIYASILIKPLNTLSLQAYVDNAAFPWLKYRVDAASCENDIMLRLNWKPSKKTELYCRYRHITREINEDEPVDEFIACTVKTQKQDLRFNAVYEVAPGLCFKDRIDYSIHEKGSLSPENGFLIGHDVVWKKAGCPYSLSFHYALFDASSYDCRLYAYENDVSGSFSMPAYYNKGFRYGVLVRFRLGHGLDLWLRFMQTRYDDVNVISSGLTQINGSVKSEIKVQLRYKF